MASAAIESPDLCGESDTIVQRVLTELQYRILRKIASGTGRHAGIDTRPGLEKLQLLLGSQILETIKGKTVIDFGCGEGKDAIALAQAGAKRVLGIDIQEDFVKTARQKAAACGIPNVEFATVAGEGAEVIVSIDAFEHFGDPELVLNTMNDLLLPGGCIVASFGPTWYHPLGGHYFSVFPWSHLVFSETALIRWRADFKSDGAKRFRDTAGGLNQMSIVRFEKLVARSPFRFKHMEAVPIRKLRLLHNRMTREFTTAIVRCQLVRKP